MNNQSILILTYLFITMGAGLVGGLLALFWRPNVKMRSAVQHFAAGAVLAAIASNVIPEVERTGTITGILSGFAAGGLAMIGLKWAVLKLEKAKKSKQRLPFGLAAAAGVDTFIDGVITRAGFFTGQQLGVLLAIALSIELFFLTLSVGAEFRKGKSSAWLGFAVTTGIVLLFGIGALGADIFLKGSSETTIAVILAFGAAALIYLIAEELLVEAIQAEESLLSTAMLFAGFFILIAIKIFNAGNPI